MKKIMGILVTSILISTPVFAGESGCDGEHEGSKVIFSARSTGKRTGEGFVEIEGTRMADFVESDVSLNFIFRTFRLENARGDVIEGKVTNIKKKEIRITKLSIPEFGINFKNFSMSCWSD
jgi:hypothetical protein